MAQLLEFLTIEQDVLDKKNDGFKDGLIAGTECVWVGVENGQPVVKKLNPLGYIEDKYTDVKWGHKANLAGYEVKCQFIKSLMILEMILEMRI